MPKTKRNVIRGKLKYAIYYKGVLVAKVQTETGLTAVKGWYGKSQQKDLKVKGL